MKKIHAVLLLVTLVLISILTLKEEQPYNTAFVLKEAWDEFGLFSYMIGDTDPIIWIQMDEEKSDLELRKYLELNLSQADLEHYSIDIIQTSIEKLEAQSDPLN
ncbi:hypothetical protein ACSVDA_01390 [Cytobacillus sp. Hm23]